MEPDHSGQRLDVNGPTKLLLACHDKIREFSTLLLRLDVHVIHYGIDDDARKAAGEVLEYFQTDVPLHHADEQADLFPLLRSFGNPGIAQALDALRIEHTQLGTLWRQVRPWLDSLQRRRPLPRPKSLGSFATRYPAYADREEQEVYWAAGQLSATQAWLLMDQMSQRRTPADAPPAGATQARRKTRT